MDGPPPTRDGVPERRPDGAVGSDRAPVCLLPIGCGVARPRSKGTLYEHLGRGTRVRLEAGRTSNGRWASSPNRGLGEVYARELLEWGCSQGLRGGEEPWCGERTGRRSGQPGHHGRGGGGGSRRAVPGWHVVGQERRSLAVELVRRCADRGRSEVGDGDELLRNAEHVLSVRAGLGRQRRRPRQQASVSRFYTKPLDASYGGIEGGGVVR
jgi:hypothetical protein